MAKLKLPVERLRDYLSQRQKHPFGLGEVPRFTPSAVLVPLFLKEGEHHMLFTKRSYEVEYYKGHISFPGGAHHPEDGTPLITALRETEEEIGLDPAQVEVVGELDPLYSSSGGFLIEPFVGIVPYPYQFRLHPVEVAHLLEVPLSHLLNRRFSWQDLRPDGRMGYFFDYQGQIIWGSTAAIVHQFLDIIAQEGFLEFTPEEGLFINGAFKRGSTPLDNTIPPSPLRERGPGGEGGKPSSEESPSHP